MTFELYPVALLALMVAMAVVAFELYASLRPPACPQCVHCRLLAAQHRQETRGRSGAGRLWGDERDEPDQDRKP